MTNSPQLKSPIPRKLDDAMITALSAYVAKGNYAQHACYLCGIDESSLYLWLKQGGIDIEAGNETLYSSLFKSLKKAKAQAQARMVDVAINSAEQKRDGYLAITFLERTDPDHWGRRDRSRIDINETREITIKHVEVRLSETDQAPAIEGESRELLPGGEE